jgi:hypothetical protein
VAQIILCNCFDIRENDTCHCLDHGIFLTRLNFLQQPDNLRLLIASDPQRYSGDLCRLYLLTSDQDLRTSIGSGQICSQKTQGASPHTTALHLLCVSIDFMPNKTETIKYDTCQSVKTHSAFLFGRPDRKP